MEMEQAYAYFASQKFNHFEVGDRVTVKKEYGANIGHDNRVPDETLIGTICKIRTDNADMFSDILIGVAFDEHIYGHDCDGTCEYGYGWFIRSRFLVPVENSLPPIPEDKLMEVLLNG